MRTIRFLFLGLFFTLLLDNELIAQNSNSIYSDKNNKTRYDDVEGTPYLYKEWLAAEVLASTGNIYTEEKVNFNGHTQKIEYFVDDEVKEMMTGTYLKVSFPSESGKQTFMRGLHPDFGMDLVIVLYDGQSVDFAKRHFVKIQEHNTPNATITKFVPRTEYYLIVNGRVFDTPLKKKKVLAALKNSPGDLEEYIEENQLSLKKEAEVIQLLEFYESNLN